MQSIGGNLGNLASNMQNMGGNLGLGNLASNVQNMGGNLASNMQNMGENLNMGSLASNLSKVQEMASLENLQDGLQVK